VPHDSVLVEVEVSDSRCAPVAADIKKRLQDLENAGLEISIAKIVAFASKHFFDAFIDYWNAGDNVAQIQTAWQNIAVWRPTKEVRRKDRISKLVVADRSNSREKARVSEILAVGVGLIAATRVYELPYRFWHPTPGLARTDYTAPLLGTGPVHLEVRGRFDRRNWRSAQGQIWEKFGATPTMSSHLGAIYAPRTTANTRSSDLILLDPSGDHHDVAAEDSYRAILRHYAPFFAHQGFLALGARLFELATASPEELAEYLRRGDETLRALRDRRRAYRTSFSIGAERFVGTAWQADLIPAHRHAEAQQEYAAGYVIWGIWEPLFDALVNGNIDAIAGAELEEWTLAPASERGDVWATYTVLEDGTALAWAPTIDHLLTLP